MFLCLLLMGACQQGSQKDELTRKKLTSKKQELRTLQGEVDSLEQALQGGDEQKRKGRSVLVRTRKIEPLSFEHTFKVNGSVKADQEVLLSAERQGKLESIHVEEGDRVEKGQLIAEQSQKILRSRLQEVKTRYEHARTLYKKQKRLWKEKGVGSELDYLNAKNKMETLGDQKRSLEEELEMTRIEAPITGTIEELRLKKGAYAAPSQPIAHLVGLKDLVVEADLSERYLSKVNRGDSVDIRFPMIDLHYERPITSVGDRIDPQDRTFETRIKLRNNEGRDIKPNLSARLTFTALRIDSARVIPSGIVQSDPKGDHVYVVSPSDTAKKRYIQIGPSQNGNSLVEEGLDLGEKVVVAGYDDLSDGTAVREEEEMSAERRSEER